MAVETVRTSPRWLDDIIGALDDEQRAAATLPDGPAQIIAPAGSGKTTTLIARLGVLLARGVEAEEICVVTFNREAALDLARRIDARLVPHVDAAAQIEVHTLHALARRVLLDGGRRAALVADRLPLVRAARRRASEATGQPLDALPEANELDGVISAWKIERRGPEGPAQAVVDEYQAALDLRGALDFDDLVVEACRLLTTRPALRLRWQSRFRHVLVDEFQDVDAAQLQLVRLLAAPDDNLMVVGDDDQTIYAWRLADVRRILRFSTEYPGARRVMLATNYRCPPAVVACSARLVGVNVERFEKPIRAPHGLAYDPGAIAAWNSATPTWTDALARLAAVEDAAGRSLCFLSRTRGELVPILVALTTAGIRHATAIPPLAEAARVVSLVDAAREIETTAHAFHLMRRLRAGHGWERGSASADLLGDDDHAALDALMGWAAEFPSHSAFIAAYDAARARIAALRDPDAPVELATVHASKGREWETVALVGFESDRIPNRRSLVDAEDPARALEEERRLAYVALTRARRQLILAFDPARPSPFLAEMGLRTEGRA